ncbi:secreted protein containing Lipase, GDSL domain protein [Candidatus Magnetomorum sp. HK-1]|nr:secreted protein containing Lipase, GDSL domain protein [Candidatus Magnetomorum sp. HK-1]
MFKKVFLICAISLTFMFSPMLIMANHNIWDVDNDDRLGLKDIIYGLQLISGHHQMPEKKKIVLINLGDSLTNGAQSGVTNVHELTQRNSFAQLLADQLKKVAEVTWNNPYLIKSETGLVKKDMDDVPYNLSVTLATIKDLMDVKTNSGNEIFTELLKPIPSLKGSEVTQLEAALYVAGLHPDKMKVFTLWIGSNDVLWSVINEFGTQITAENINAYLNDTTAEHDLNSVKNNLLEIINTLKTVENSHIFIGTLPYMSGTSFFFYKDDIERLAQFPNPVVTELPEGESLGFGPFIELAISGVLSKMSSNEYLNNAISQIVTVDEKILSLSEKQIIDQRIDDINTYIKSLESPGKVTVVDTFQVFQAMYNNDLEIDEHQLKRIFGGGLFSLDAFHPTNTGHAFIANKFIESISQALDIAIPLVDILNVFQNDPYQDKDGDGFIVGPQADLIDPSIVGLGLTDCNDTDPSIIAPFISNGDSSCGAKK